MLLTNIAGSGVMNIWWPLALITPTIGDFILTRFSCNAYYLLCFAWTFYLLDSLATTVNSKLNFLVAIHHVFVVCLLSVVVWTKTLVFLTALGLVSQINTLQIYSILAIKMYYGTLTGNWLVRAMVKAIPPLLLAIRLPLFFWIQWQLFAHWGNGLVPKWIMITMASCMFGLLVQNLLQLEKLKNKKFWTQLG